MGTDEPTRADRARLTHLPVRRAVFAEDLDFRECWADVTAVPGARELLPRVAMLVAKPDAVVGRRLRAIGDHVMTHGFRPIACAPARLNRHAMRALWRWDWHVYPVDRLAFATHWYTAADLLVMFFEDVAPAHGLAATTRLAARKGHSLAERRRPDDLRTVLRPPNRIFNFVHAADDPADIVRELGVFFDRDERRALLEAAVASLGQDRSRELADAVTALEARFPAHDLDLDASLDRLERTRAIAAGDARELRRAAAIGETLAWDAICARIDPASGWDFLSVAARILPTERR